MKLTLAEPKYLKESVSIISELVNEATFKITKNAIELVAMDPANVAMVVFKLLSSTFVEYDVQEDTEIAINLSNLKQVLRRAKPSDMLSLEVHENKLKIILQGASKRTFSLPIIELEEKEQKVPDLNFPITISAPSYVLSDAVEDVDIIGESVSFMIDGKKLVISAESDLSEANIAIQETEEVKIMSDVSEVIKAKYSIEYLKKMMNAGKLVPEVKINFNKDYPLRLDYKAVDKIMLSFILAPRVEND
ncbi:proliferating cell nuclear antigen (pcna) [Candidatus Woesearchaeota archaeon]|jgi:proliferating cell nuclear antigen|nr:proliferating cell nuclear antigen (pcna) [Candidatus Woesearchaeota archaeon]MBT5271872.1 proliferating cell nuclear antigen (pcna) [Candidatus Woesearchaeota archaeon]MBT6041664.1 proliferating cell nuclear antigen (pcna) [Candidatus Woesearchaeota archaeon]MBT6337360.1 proliferating cell nuclear antigen (pcna) [Candidatus Woesearchaeota archaeon]MBT7927608.1 proliferating cell nuclear antigen (pcna) [Candidatus Woesearchaeota archaeon]